MARSCQRLHEAHIRSPRRLVAVLVGRTILVLNGDGVVAALESGDAGFAGCVVVMCHGVPFGEVVE